jgi:threonine synthase
VKAGTYSTSNLYAKYRRFLPSLRDYAAADRGQGLTPLVRSCALGPRAGVHNLFFKLEMSNPTGSYKDRFAGLALALAREAGASACLATSSGNTGAALAAIAAALGMQAFLFVNEHTPVGKLVQMRAHGARIFRVRGMGIDANESVEVIRNLRAVSEAKSIPLLVSAFAQSPHGMAGIKTIAYEIAEQLQPVDHVFCPVGGGGLYTAIARGFVDLRAEGAAMPRVHPVQPVLNDTVITPLRNGSMRAQTVSTTTSLSGLAVPFDLDASLVIELARSCGSEGVLVQDAEALDAQRRLMVEEGLLVEPAGAVSVAGFLAAASAGHIPQGQHVVCVLTGHGFKDPASIEAASSANEVQQIDGREIDAVLR